VLIETTAEKLASRMLAQTGIAAIWDAHVAAAAAYGLGKPDIAAELLKIAEAAERLWLVRAHVRLSGSEWYGRGAAADHS